MAEVLGSVRGIPAGLENFGYFKDLHDVNPRFFVPFVVFVTVGLTLEISERSYYLAGEWPIFTLAGLAVLTGVWVFGVMTVWKYKARYPRQLGLYLRS